MRIPACLLAVLLLCGGASAETTPLTANDTARLLAGLPAATDSSEVRDQKVWQTYHSSVGPMWADFEKQRGTTMASWAAGASAGADADVVFYPFGGPDFITVQRLHPNARHYTLVAQETAAPLPELLPSAELEKLLAPFESATLQFTTLGYFATAALRRYTTRLGEAEAITGILALSAARAGYEVRSVGPLKFDEEQAAFVPGEPGGDTWEAVRFTLARKDGETVILDYVVLDLKDGFLRKHPRQEAWLREQSKNHIFLKAATHALQGRHFKIAAKHILDNAPSVLQDESGLALPAMEEDFDVRLFGHFEKVSPHLFLRKDGKGQRVPPLVQTAADALAVAYRERDDVEPLPFTIGYVKDAGSSLQYAVRREQR